MDRLIKKDLAKQTEDLEDDEGKPAAPRFVFKRIRITIDQAKKYKYTHLMHPDPETLAKPKEKKGKLADAFKREFGSLFQIELDALQLIPNYQTFITAEIDKPYDNQVR